jgi:hypothetical protein
MGAGNPKKAVGAALEKKVVERAQEAGLDARKQPGSGVFKGYPSDAVIEQWLVECKVRSLVENAAGESRYPLDLGVVEKVGEQARAGGFVAGALVIRAKRSRKLYTVLDFDTFLGLLSASKPAQK